jgi:hypothetical protein
MIAEHNHRRRSAGGDQRVAMRRRFAALFIALIVICALSACAAGPRVAGNEIGGAVSMAGITREQAFDAAQSHCAKYGHAARILAVRADTVEKAVFECI